MMVLEVGGWAVAVQKGELAATGMLQPPASSEARAACPCDCLQVIAYLAGLHASGMWRPTLVVAPATVLRQWMSELRTW
jgi:hypothetical protein